MKHLTLDFLFRNKKNNFNFIRLIAAFMVIYGHSNAIVVNGGADFITKHLNFGFTGGIAVDVFFVISGFLVTASMSKGKLSYYIKSRVLRIYPALIFWVAISAFIIAPIFSNSDYLFSNSVMYFLNMASAYNVIFFIDGVFASNRDHAVNGVLWSVIVETRLYLAVFVFYIIGVLKSKTVFNVFFYISLIVFYFYPEYAPIAASTTDLHVISLFLIGGFYWINKDSIIISPFYAMLMFVIAFLGFKLGEFKSAYIFVLPYFVFCIAYMKGLCIFRKIGDYSYGIYLVGWPVQQVIVAIYPQISLEWHQFFSILFALILGIFSWHMIEKPFLNMKNINFTNEFMNVIFRLHKYVRSYV